jgi:hypothetical protein
MIVIKLSGGDVIEVQNDSGEEIEVRQYHRDFNGGEDLTEDASGYYLVTYPETAAMTNDEIIRAVKTYCADLHDAHVEREERYGRVDGQKAWTGEDADHVAGLLNQASGEFDSRSLFRFIDEQTGSWRVGYKTDDGREWFHILRQMRNAPGGLIDALK